MELGGVNGGFGFLLGNGDGTFGALGGIGFTGVITLFQIKDVNGDGRPELLLFVHNNPPNDVGLITLINVSGPAVPDFTISATPVSPESIVAGTTAATTVTLAPLNGFSAGVTLSCSGLPAGAGCSFTPPTIPGGAGTSTVTITTGASVPANTYFVSVVGTSITRTHATLKMLTVTSTTPPDFSLAPASTATATVTAGQAATYMLSLGGGGGFSGSVTLSCSGAPAGAACSVSPAMVSVSGATPATATATVTTTARSQALLPAGDEWLRGFRGRPTALLAGLMAIVILAWCSIARRHQQLRWAPVLAIALVLGLGITLTSCGGGGSARGSSGATGTQAGTYTITVSASATSGSMTLTHSTKLTIVVQ